MKMILRSLLISILGVFVIDYLSHLLFSNPMETMPYFLTKFVLYLAFSVFFLSFADTSRKEFLKTAAAGMSVALLWGFYYNILPVILETAFDIEFYPFGIPLEGLTFLGTGLFLTGLAFGVVHTIAFIGGYYSTKFLA